MATPAQRAFRQSATVAALLIAGVLAAVVYGVLTSEDMALWERGAFIAAALALAAWTARSYTRQYRRLGQEPDVTPSPDDR